MKWRHQRLFLAANCKIFYYLSLLAMVINWNCWQAVSRIKLLSSTSVISFMHFHHCVQILELLDTTFLHSSYIFTLSNSTVIWCQIELDYPISSSFALFECIFDSFKLVVNKISRLENLADASAFFHSDASCKGPKIQFRFLVPNTGHVVSVLVFFMKNFDPICSC